MRSGRLKDLCEEAEELNHFAFTWPSLALKYGRMEGLSSWFTLNRNVIAVECEPTGLLVPFLKSYISQSSMSHSGGFILLSADH